MILETGIVLGAIQMGFFDFVGEEEDDAGENVSFTGVLVVIAGVGCLRGDASCGLILLPFV